MNVMLCVSTAYYCQKGFRVYHSCCSCDYSYEVFIITYVASVREYPYLRVVVAFYVLLCCIDDTSFTDIRTPFRYFYPSEIASVCEKVGMRAMIGMTVIDVPTSYAATTEEYILKGMDVYYEYNRNSTNNNGIPTNQIESNNSLIG